MRELLDKSELQDILSEYLCQLCYEPLYYDIVTKKEFCINAQCSCSTDEKILKNDPNGSDIKPFYDKYDKIKSQCFEFDKSFFYIRLYELRAQALNGLFTQNGIPLKTLLGINLLLTKIAETTAWGSLKNLEKCDNVIEKCLEQYAALKDIETIRVGLHRMGSKGTVFRLKYTM